MLSEGQREQVWECWLAAEIRAAYFGELAQWFHRIHRLVNLCLLVLSSGAFVAVVAKVGPPWLLPVLSAFATILSIYALVSQFVKSAVESRDLHARWNRLANDYRDLWNNVYATDAQERLARLNERRAEASASGLGMALPYREKRMLKWEEYVIQHRVRPQPKAA